MLSSKDFIVQLAKKTEPVMAWKPDKDQEAWKAEAREKLEELLGLPLSVCDPEFQITERTEEEKFDSISFRYQSEPGYYIPGTLLVPKGADKPLPVVICLQGHSSGAHLSLGKVLYDGDEKSIAGGRDFAVRAVEEGFCAIAIEQRYLGALSGRERGLPGCGGKANGGLGSFLMGRTPIGERVWDIHILLNVIESYFQQYIDSSRIICMGNSGGGTAAFYASCYDERICMAMPSCAVCSYEESIMPITHCTCNCVPGIRKYFDMGDLGVLNAPRPVVLVCGIQDEMFPLSGVEKSYATMQEAYESRGIADLCQLVKGEGGHQFYPDEAWPVAKMLLAKVYGL